ncbi:ABC transporter permease [Nocardioides houyundeii]|uniref:ABC transporter permease n=1 Tax=Nocardioides houyundeii TaxID=2045452 RepID=UPI000DF14260|nr:ABC transporter permease [Nocardioides houyundeii]
MTVLAESGTGWTVRPSLHRLRRVATGAGRLLAAFVPVFLLGSIFTFLLGALSGRSPAVIQLGENATPEAVEAMNKEWGLGRPFLVQYVDWLGDVLRGDFGVSWANNTPVSELLAGRAAISLSVAVLALVLGVVVGSALGALAAHYHGSWFDRGVTIFTSIISVMPPFIVGIALIVVVAVRFEWLPAAGYVPFEQGVWPWLSHIILPALALSLDTISDMARQLRVGLLNTSKENYVTGAIVRGLSPRRVFFVHTLRNGVGPAIAVLGLKFPNLLGGAVVTESIFQLSGYGLFSAQSAIKGDVPAVQAVLVVAVILVVVFNLVVNAVLALLIPASKRGV